MASYSRSQLTGGTSVTPSYVVGNLILNSEDRRGTTDRQLCFSSQKRHTPNAGTLKPGSYPPSWLHSPAPFSVLASPGQCHMDTHGSAGMTLGQEAWVTSPEIFLQAPACPLVPSGEARVQGTAGWCWAAVLWSLLPMLVKLLAGFQRQLSPPRSLWLQKSAKSPLPTFLFLRYN